jgi:hypothetical protein
MSSVFVPNILSTVFSNTFSLCSSLIVADRSCLFWCKSVHYLLNIQKLSFCPRSCVSRDSHITQRLFPCAAMFSWSLSMESVKRELNVEYFSYLSEVSHPVILRCIAYEDVWRSGCIDPRFLDLGISLKSVISFIPGERAPGTHWIGGWVSPRGSLDDIQKWKFLPPSGLELRPLFRPARS